MIIMSETQNVLRLAARQAGNMAGFVHQHVFIYTSMFPKIIDVPYLHLL